MGAGEGQETSLRRVARWFGLHPSSLAPLDVHTVIHMASSLDRREAADARRTTTLRSLRLDHHSRVLRGGGQEVALTAREFELLSVLMAGAGSVQHRQNLLRQVWGPDGGTDDALSVCVYRLRTKLGEIPEMPQITTVHGIGYRLDL